MSAMWLMTLSVVLGQYGSVDTVDGFTTDGAWLVGSTRSSNLLEGQSSTSWYQSTVTGVLTEFEDQEDGSASPAFAAWRTTHPLGEQPLDGRTSPDGLVTIDVVLERAGVTGEGWSADATWRVLAKSKDRTRFLMNFSNTSRCEISWAPNSRAVLVRTHSTGTTWGIRGASLPTENDSVHLWPLDVPVINVAGLSPKTTAGMIKKLPPGPRYVPSIAVKKREATVVYFAPGQEPRARLMLPHLPGATLKAMDWQAPYDVVVALGGL